MIKIYGKNCIQEAVRANAGLETVFLLKENENKDKGLCRLLTDKGIKYEILLKDKMNRLFGTSHQGYAAYRRDYPILEEKDLERYAEAKRILLLDGIMDPHNLGAILRSVDAFGIDLVILPKNRSCFITETVAHVSTGAIEHTDIMMVNSLFSVVQKLKGLGFWICGTDAKGSTIASSINKDLKLAVIIGSEGFGMSKTLLNASDYLITIPMVGHVNSLNASVSCAIVLYDLMEKGE